MQKTFHIYKSSAGSGKTYTLVKEYLKIVLQQPTRVSNILAITFTNAAAAEMKSRILEELALIQDLEENPGNVKATKFLKELREELILELGEDQVLPPAEHIRNAGGVLRFILHNYSDFSVSTIDSFVHRIIRTFAFDLHLPLNFEVELDANALLEQAVDLLISRVGHDKQLTRVLIAFIERQTDNQRDVRIEVLITKLARTLMDEEGALSIEKLKDISLDDFFEMIRELQKEIASFENQVQALAQQAMDLIHQQGIAAEAFYQGGKGIFNYFLQLSNGLVAGKILPNNYVITTLEDDKWCSGKATALDKQNIEVIRPRLIGIWDELLELRNHKQEDYFLSLAVNSNIFPLAVLSETGKVLQQVKDDNILLHISDFNKKIADIIALQPVPFIYERIGERYQHYMIDEFQDTSSLQWQNLLPLVENSLATGNTSLVVGDGKQAIYRWRSGDVAQFASLPLVPDTIRAAFRPQWEASLVRNHEIRNLETNWRSRKQIVAFNNEFFETSRQLLSPELSNIYDEVKQKSLESKPGGYIEICFVQDKDPDDECLQQQQTLVKIIDTIQRLRECGHPLSDITILCRANSEGSLVARHLLENNIRVISSESLLLNQSNEVTFMCSLLKLAVNRQDKVALAELLGYLFKAGRIPTENGFHHYLKTMGLFAPVGNGGLMPERLLEQLLMENGIQWSFTNILSQNIYDACETILRAFFPSANPPNPFLAFFMDVVFDYSEKYNLSIADFLEWWEKEGHKHSLELPQGLDAVQVMTIHRSKGLQFPVVIYPFAQPGATRQTKDGQWADLNLDVVPKLKTAWVSLSEAGTRNTPFAELLQTEKDKTFLDLLNILYVAFTRPQEKLFIISGPVACNTKTGLPNPQPQSVNGMLYQFLEEKQMWQQDQNTYCIGTFGKPDKVSLPAPPATDFFTQYLSAPWHRAIRLKSNQSQGFIPEQPLHLQKGNLLHHIMESIHSISDIDPVLHRMVVNGELDGNDSKLWAEKLVSLLSHPELEGCYQPHTLARSEAGIFDANGMFYRPDRVAFLKDRTIIIDYKTGQEYPHHAAQMETYGTLLLSMGYPGIKKVLIYLDQDKVYSV